MIPQLLQGQKVKEWRRLFVCATSHFADDKERLRYLPQGVQRTPADIQWAFEAAKCETLEEALDVLEKRLDGSKDKLTAVTDFFRLEPVQQPLSADGLSVFFFKVMDTGKTAGLTNDLRGVARRGSAGARAPPRRILKPARSAGFKKFQIFGNAN